LRRAPPAGGKTRGPLAGVRVLDVSALGPGPFCSMLLADYGAEVVAIERPRRGAPEPTDVADYFSRGKRVVTVDLRAPHGAELIATLADHSDVFLEGYRPGTMERRGLGPDVLLARNPGLIYTRLTGWGQTGPYARRAGHDINYIAIGGALGAIGSAEPVPPLNLLGDFASGSLMAALGTMLALFERQRTGRGQVVDAAMADGAALLLSSQLAELARGTWPGRGRSLLSGCAPFYSVYRCADGGFFSVGAIEPKFYADLLCGLGFEESLRATQYDESNWLALRERMADTFVHRTRSEWVEVFADLDACAFPVLEVNELARDPHLAARGTVVEQNGRAAAASAPRLSEGRVGMPSPGALPEVTRSVLEELGLLPADVERYLASGTLKLSEVATDLPGG
jgi:alpha-methylacyl-CoA racemase